MKLDKGYYRLVIEELSKLLLKEKNKLSQILEQEMKEYGRGFGYSTNYLDIEIIFRKKRVKE